MVAVQHDLKKEPWLISLGTGLVVFSESSLYFFILSIINILSKLASPAELLPSPCPVAYSKT